MSTITKREIFRTSETLKCHLLAPFARPISSFARPPSFAMFATSAHFSGLARPVTRSPVRSFARPLTQIHLLVRANMRASSNAISAPQLSPFQRLPWESARKKWEIRELGMGEKRKRWMEKYVRNMYEDQRGSLAAQCHCVGIALYGCLPLSLSHILCLSICLRVFLMDC